ncbi:hypothetical protein AOX59_04190 [Lentibacillus amyloliquefaciens]|uniref:DUF2621 domain-containing protein n=2 Tax=Lentibacillus amyloliquefaciens TaxID=1472767 RepID=A0A0U3W3X2_9BACI|nr:hypothetical protein AOX59_04190 [Lentibacillus amyloliquefaciens]
MIDDILIIFWGFLMISLMGIGGYFMFRKFLKQLPKEDGHSNMEWEEYYVNNTSHLWQETEKSLLEELVSPVPELFRDVARHKIAGKIGEIALKKENRHITQDTLIEGYILATPKRDHKFLRKKLKEKEIDVEPYEHLFELSRSNYADNWKSRYKKMSSEKVNSLKNTGK